MTSETILLWITHHIFYDA